MVYPTFFCFVFISTEEDLHIDPVMQKYMLMVQQRKQQESAGSKVTKSEQEDEDEEVEQKVSMVAL